MISQVKAAGRRAIAWSCHHSRYSLRRLAGTVAIVGYHRVLSREDLREEFVQPGMYVETEVFEAHVRFLKEQFRVVSLAEALELWAGNDWDPRARYCVITLDDGWLDNYTRAFPILRRYGVPATIFVATGFIGTDQRLWSDDLCRMLRAYHAATRARSARPALRALAARHPWLGVVGAHAATDAIDAAIEVCKQMPESQVRESLAELGEALDVPRPRRPAFLRWEEIREMSLHGVSFGSHSCRHRIMTRLGSDEIRREAEDSLRALQVNRANVVPVFCYPNGDVDGRVAAEVRDAGYRAAVSGRFGVESRTPDDPFRLRRVSVHNDVAASVPLFAIRLAGIGVTLSG